MGNAEHTDQIVISEFDSERHDPQLIAETHLAVRYWQVLNQNNRFSNFFESQADLPILERQYPGRGGNFFIATDQETDVITGFVGLMNRGDGVGEIKRMAVLPDYHRRGIGAALIRTAIAWALEHDYHKLTLQTGPRENGKSLYEKCGFIEVGRVLRNQDYIMELPLLGEL